jgi:hypothetical protein
MSSHFSVGASFFLLLVIAEPFWGLTGPRWEMQKGHRIDRHRKLGPGVLGAQVETHNPHCFFSVSLFFKALLLYSSLKPCFTIL